jgi:hypothetical protein
MAMHLRAASRLLLCRAPCRLPSAASLCTPFSTASTTVDADTVLTDHCRQGRLDHAERLLVTWLGNFNKLEGASDFIAVLGNRDSMQEGVRYKPKDIRGEEDALLKGEGSAHFPSMASWHALMTMYADRQAGYHCKSVFQFLEGVEKSIAGAVAGSDGGGGSGGDGHVLLSGLRIPVDIQADERIHKDYVRALCSTESFSTAFQLLASMVAEKGMKLDAHVIIALLKMVNKPGLVSEAAIPRLADLTMELVKHLHDLESSVSQKPSEEEDAYRGLPRKHPRSPDSCRVLNSLVTVLCSRG